MNINLFLTVASTQYGPTSLPLYQGSSWFSLASSLAGVVMRTGEAVAEVVDREGGLRESLGGDNVTQVRDWRRGRHVASEVDMTRGRLMPCNDCLPPVEVVSDSVQSLLLLVPQIKANISQAIGMVPQVGRTLT